METYSPANTADLERSILWQYEKAAKLNAIISNQQAFFDENVTAFWDDFYTDVFNLETANDFGLTIWGIMLGVNWPTYNDGSGLVAFSSDSYRLILNSRILLQQMDATTPAINNYLDLLFGSDRRIEFTDNLDMTITYLLYFTPTTEESALLAVDGILPRPAGVEAIIASTVPSEIFGFAGQRLGQLDNSVFVEEPAITQDRVMWTDSVFINTGSNYLVWE